MKIQKIAIFASVLLCFGFLSGCSIKDKTPPSIAYYTIDYDVPALNPVPALPVTLSIEKFRTSPPFNTNRIIYSKNRFSQNKYYYHQWMSAPDEMITRLLARDLVASNRFLAVIASGNAMTTHQLTGTVDEFYEQDTDSQWNGVLSVTISLVDLKENDDAVRFILQKNYKKSYPLDQNNPIGLTRALSLAMSEISGLIISDIYQALQ